MGKQATKYKYVASLHTVIHPVMQRKIKKTADSRRTGLVIFRQGLSGKALQRRGEGESIELQEELEVKHFREE